MTSVSRPRRAGALLIAAGLGLASCAGGDAPSSGQERAAETATTVTTTTTPGGVGPPSTAVAEGRVAAAPPRPSPGCAATPQALVGVEELVVPVEGTDRQVRRFVPSAAGGGEPMPVVLDLHGLTSGRQQQAALSAWEELAEREGVVVLTPQGLPAELPGWSGDPDSDDVAFVAELLDRTGAELCVDERRVYANGLSNGGLFSSALACGLDDRIAAIAPVAGVQFPDGCELDRPVPVSVSYGLRDTILPWDGGVGDALVDLLGPDAVADLGADVTSPVGDVIDDWVAADGCEAEPQVIQHSEHVERRIWQGCDGGVVVQLWLVSDGGHAWPGSEAMQAIVAGVGTDLLGVVTDEVDATEQNWAFFERYALP